MTWSNVYWVFPEHTFLEPRTQYRLKSLEECSTKHMTKYANRGWKIMGTMVNPGSSSGSFRTNTVRRVGNSKSWKLILDVTGVIPSMMPNSVIEHSYFYLSKLGDTYTCEATKCRNHALKYKYTRSVRPDSHHSKTFWAFIGHRLRIVTVAEILRLNPQEIPEDIVVPTLSEMMSPKHLMYTFMEKISEA